MQRYKHCSARGANFCLFSRIPKLHRYFWLATPHTHNRSHHFSHASPVTPFTKLMNGTKYLAISYRRNVVEVEGAVGSYAGERPTIPRISLHSSGTSLPFQF
ncbi:hypothetical protein ElyMa_006870900 [Elysia marginata]|uniref:Uncharacterized protein n=1 Tax=Elysia marginata TaxID=1093978 RepID=A0AAV4J967_9GAST|nr:hypothetical protein ElyMa_006870900 [Elysia marginata]